MASPPLGAARNNPDAETRNNAHVSTDAAALTAEVRKLVQPGDTITIPEPYYYLGNGTLRMEVSSVGTILQIGALVLVELRGWETSRLLPGRSPRRAAVHLAALRLPGAVTRPLDPE
ncbi:hypothetical protein GCM10027280_00930 [Micromonospora polyrhachis]|uniref:Uncharacterized protein n=1 Tax=Micromonospora polyrhachis TaxID=1282883 RepID=A0A7W7SNS9_9ACTN|nr:hypothetical protein [Micromonospora polyrhachis]MBB4957612.1 hypothetical protein [Micromonospora polyrhachis]